MNKLIAHLQDKMKPLYIIVPILSLAIVEGNLLYASFDDFHFSVYITSLETSMPSYWKEKLPQGRFGVIAMATNMTTFA